ncbi:alpha/beta fold hydrolase [Nitratireductor basaltis]|uniref:Alpha/beta hydrolase n=1 Tax=Nitratireductor basaltis TaxID=472175 RepID=A0A084UAS0_9HYPH|nr:alpha/beta hydrolase [Nitratireductor basaltis]KFB10056.1 Alpha/beta hydrolase [Nitratireductor basaltis]
MSFLRQEIDLVGAEGNHLKASLWGGQGQPVLFFHGGGQTRYAWDATAERLAKCGMRAITIDQRGHGESDWVESENYSFGHYAEDVAAIVAQIMSKFHQRPSAVGASLGGLASLGALIRDRDLLESLVLVDITPRMDPEGVARIQGFMGARMDEGFASLEEAAESIAQYLPHRRKPRSLEGLRKNLRLCDDGRYRWHWDPAFIRGRNNINCGAEKLVGEMIEALPRLRLPVLLVRGMQSELVHEEYAREFVEMVPSASYIDVGGAGHMVAGDRNDVFSRAVLDFLTGDQAA